MDAHEWQGTSALWRLTRGTPNLAGSLPWCCSASWDCQPQGRKVGSALRCRTRWAAAAQPSPEGHTGRAWHQQSSGEVLQHGRLAAGSLRLTAATGSGAAGAAGGAELALLSGAPQCTFVARTGCRERWSRGTAGLVLWDQEWASSRCLGATLRFDVGTPKGG